MGVFYMGQKQNRGGVMGNQIDDMLYEIEDYLREIRELKEQRVEIKEKLDRIRTKIQTDIRYDTVVSDLTSIIDSIKEEE